MLPRGEGGAHAGVRRMRFVNRIQGSRGAAALFVLVVSTSPALAEVCDKSEDVPLSTWMVLIPLVLLAWLVVCWHFRVWQVYLGLAALLLLYAASGAYELFFNNASLYRASIQEGCATVAGGILGVVLLTLISVMLGWSARWLHGKTKPEH